MKPVYLILGIATLMSACSKTSDYAPQPGETASQIFQAACVECHADAAPKIFELAADTANVETISAKINQGNLMMPAFPEIKGEKLKALSEYILSNSATK